MLAYPAKITYSRKDRAYLVRFIDFPNINTYGDTLEEALVNGQTALGLSFEVDFERRFSMPKPSRLEGPSIYSIPLPLHVEIPFRLRQLRGRASQLEIATRLKVTPQAYQKFENPRKCNITLRKLEELGRIFGCQFRVTLTDTAPTSRRKTRS